MNDLLQKETQWVTFSMCVSLQERYDSLGEHSLRVSLSLSFMVFEVTHVEWAREEKGEE